MKVEFRKSFEKDLKTIKDTKLLKKIKSVIVGIEKVDNLTNFQAQGISTEVDADSDGLFIGNFFTNGSLDSNVSSFTISFDKAVTLDSYVIG